MSGPQGPTERDPDQPDPAEQDSRGPTIRDRRRIDPETGAVRSAPDAPKAPAGPESAAPTTGAGSGSDTDRVTLLEMELAERTQDLQRVQAEYVNYRRRMDRDRIAARDVTVAGVVADLMPVLDDIGRAEEHGELVGGFKSVADALDAVLTRYGVQRFGEAGDPFDPAQHEALLHTYSDEVTETTCQQVFQPGYRLGDRVIRPARVAVADPTEALPPVDEATADEPGSAPPPAG